MGVRVSIDRDALRRHLHGPETQVVLDYVVDVVKHNAEDNTPEKTGTAKHSYSTQRPSPLRRRLYFGDWFAHLIEWGSSNNPVYAPMRRGAREAGLRFTEDPKP